MRNYVASAKRRTYDHRIREAIVSSGDATLFSELSIPRSTKHTWLRRGAPRVVIANNIDQPDLRCQRAANQTALGWVAPGGCPPGAPVDPDVRNYRIRLPELQVRCGALSPNLPCIPRCNCALPHTAGLQLAQSRARFSTKRRRRAIACSALRR